MKTPLAALLTFTLLTTSSAVYQCLDSAPYLKCCQNHPFTCQTLRDPDQDPSKPPGNSYQPADLAAFTTACERLGGGWPACCYIDPKITSCNRAFNNPPRRRRNLHIANWGTLEGYSTNGPEVYQTHAPKE